MLLHVNLSLYGGAEKNVRIAVDECRACLSVSNGWVVVNFRATANKERRVRRLTAQKPHAINSPACVYESKLLFDTLTFFHAVA